MDIASSLLIPLDPAQPDPLQHQIYDGVRRAILDGAIVPGTRLPSSRALAVDLAVSRTTTVLAYDQLIAEGYVETRHGSGTFVARELPDERVDAMPRPQPRGARPYISARANAVARVSPAARRLGRGARPFRLGVPALDAFPVRTWSQLALRRLRSLSLSQLDYGEPFGFRPLREAIAAHVQLARGARCSADQVLIVSGAQRGLDLLCRLILDPGDSALLEEPGYPGALSAMIDAGAIVTPAPVDDEGLNIETAARSAPAAKLVYVTPSHQFPLGVSMSVRRRDAVLEWARRAGVWIIEDDYDSEFRYGAGPVPSLHGLDADGRVLYVGTFSKSLFPSLRLAFVLVPHGLIEPLHAASRAAAQQPSMLEQMVLADFIAGGHFERHLRRMRGVYRERVDALTEAAADVGGDTFRLRPPTTGLHAVGDLFGVRDRDVAAAAAARGIETMALSGYCLAREPAVNGLVLGFGCVRPDALREGMARLAEAIEAVASGRTESPRSGPPAGGGLDVTLIDGATDESDAAVCR